MGRIMAIDYGRKRVGISVTDPGRIIATGLDTIPSHQIFVFLKQYLSQEVVDLFVVGEPKQMDNTPSESHIFIEPFVKKLRKTFPDIPVRRHDERFTSKMASQALIDAGASRKQRQRKDLIDKVSATLILQSYLETEKNQRVS